MKGNLRATLLETLHWLVSWWQYIKQFSWSALSFVRKIPESSQSNSEYAHTRDKKLEPFVCEQGSV